MSLMRTMTRARLTALLVAALGASAVLACTTKETSRERSEVTPSDDGSDGEPSRGREALANQSQAVQVLLTANDAEVREAKVAVARASEPDVRALAEGFVRDHEAANTRLKGIIERNGIEPAVTPTSDRIKFDSDSAVSHLEQITDSMFDRSFLTRQINTHKSLISLVDQEITPVIEDADLRQEVVRERASMQQHLEQAEDIMERLPTGTPPDLPDGGQLGELEAGLGGGGDSGDGGPTAPGLPPALDPGDAGAL